MNLFGRRESDNVEDRRGVSGGGKLAIGGGAIGIIFLILKLLFGGENAQMLNNIEEQVQTSQQSSASNDEQRELTSEEKALGKFASQVLADTEDMWAKIFKENEMEYQNPGMVLFSSEVQSGCGTASSAAGPFYCPADNKVYMDLAFFDELKSRFGAEGGDFAIAYVIAHEVGHHVQNLLGTSEKVRALQSRKSEENANKLSVAMELQADFYAGVYAKYSDKENHTLQDGDLEEALSAAKAVGDDAIQKKLQGYVQPESFTHGTSEQRMFWFKKGFTTGDIKKGDTFASMN